MAVPACSPFPMFANLPHKLAPFGLLGDEAKLAFPVQPGGIAKLASVRVRIDFLCDCAYSAGVNRIYLRMIVIGSK